MDPSVEWRNLVFAMESVRFGFPSRGTFVIALRDCWALCVTFERSLEVVL